MTSSNYMATSMASSNSIAMILMKLVIDRVVVRPMIMTLYIVSVTSITMVKVAVRGGRRVILTEINILGMLLSA